MRMGLLFLPACNLHSNFYDVGTPQREAPTSQSYYFASDAKFRLDERLVEVVAGLVQEASVGQILKRLDSFPYTQF